MRISLVLVVLLTAAPLQAAPNELKEHKGEVTAVTFSPDGTRLLSVGEDGQAIVWDVKTQKVVHRCPAKEEKLFAAAWRPDKAQFALAGEYGVVRVWEVGGKKPLAEFKGHHGPVAALAYRPDGAVIASGGCGRTVRFWSLDQNANEALRFDTIKDTDGRVTSLAYTADGKELVVGTAELTEQRVGAEVSLNYGEGGFVRVYDPRTQNLVRQLDVRGSHVALAGDRVLAVGLVGHTKQAVEEGKPVLHTGGTTALAVADLNTGKRLATVNGSGLSAAWSRDGSVLVCGGWNHRHYPGNIILGDADGDPTGAAVATPLAAGAKVTTRAVDPRERGPNNVFAGQFAPLALRDETTLKKGAVIEKDVECVAVSPDGKLIAVGGSEGTIRLYPSPTK